MQNDIRKSWNNTPGSPVREIESNLGNIAHFIVKETHRLHNSVTEPDMTKLTSCFFQCFITRPLLPRLDTWHFLTSSMDLLIHTKRNLLIYNNFDQIWFWKNIPITFSQGCTILTYSWPLKILNTDLVFL